ncbi:MAG: translation elongation factor Ts [Acidobacteriota bacterium]|nr:translation elongation factor Ts [Acidobacteriota bacterium]
MADFTAKDVKALRDSTGAGMMDAKKALTETDGDFDAAIQWLRERGLGKAAERADRESADGAVAVARVGDAASLVELKSETDFVAKSPQFVAMIEKLAAAVAADGEGAVESHKDALDDLRVTLKENIQLGTVARLSAGPGQVLESYLHVQNGRGVNGVIVLLDGGTSELAHDLAVHVAFGRPSVLSRDQVPAEEVESERSTLEAQTRNEGKPEAAVEKIVDGKLNGWYKRVPGGVLLEQPYAKDDKLSVTQFLGGVGVIGFAQAVIGS